MVSDLWGWVGNSFQSNFRGAGQSCYGALCRTLAVLRGRMVAFNGGERMRDTDKYERTTPELEEFEGENLGDLITNLLTEVKRLRKLICQLETIRIMDSPLHNHPKLWDDIEAVHEQRENDIWEEGKQ